MHRTMTRIALPLAVATICASVVALASLAQVDSAHSGESETRTLASDDSYRLELELPAAVAKGSEGVAFVTIAAKAGWHVNQDFPTKLTIDAPDGVEVDKAVQRADDAVKLTDHEARFAIKYTATSAGTKAFGGSVKFAVCTDDTCDPKRVKLAFKVDVQ